MLRIGSVAVLLLLVAGCGNPWPRHFKGRAVQSWAETQISEIAFERVDYAELRADPELEGYAIIGAAHFCKTPHEDGTLPHGLDEHAAQVGAQRVRWAARDPYERLPYHAVGWVQEALEYYAVYYRKN